MFDEIKQDRQCTEKVTLKRFRATSVAVEKPWELVLHNLSVCICSLRYPVFNAHAPYFYLWPAHFYNTFSTFSHKRQDFWKKITEYKMCSLIFCTTSVWKFYHFKEKWVRCDKKYVLVFMHGTVYSRPSLMKLEFSRQVFEKYSNVRFPDILPVGAELFHADGRTDGQAWRI